MAMQPLRVPERTFSVGRVFERAFAAIRHNPIVTLGLAILFGALPSLGIEFVLMELEAAASSDPSISTSLFQLFALIGLFSLVGALSQAAFTWPLVAHAEGRRATIGECLFAVATSIIPLILLTVLSIVAITLGLAALLVPGLMLWVIWMVAVPALVVERRGVLKSLRRSAELTKGARWSLFGLLLVLTVASMGIALTVEAVTGQLQNEEVRAALEDPLFLSLTLITDTLMTLLYAAVIASLYVELRDWKGGPASEHLEDVFS